MNDETVIETPGCPLPEGEYAIVEILGHRTLVGRIGEVERFGTKLLSVEPIWDGELLPAVLHHGTAIYGLTACTREVAWERRAKADYQLPGPVRATLPQTALPPPRDDYDDLDYDDLDDDDLDDDDRPF